MGNTIDKLLSNLFLTAVSNFSWKESGKQILQGGPGATRIYNGMGRKGQTSKEMQTKPIKQNPGISTS